jgi:TonB dependent receptor
MTVLSNSFSAEFGGSTGSAVNIVTRSGGNRLRGEVLAVWRPSATQAALSGFTSTNAASGNDITSNTMGQTDVSLGGPAGRGSQTHFFSAGEFIRENRASPIISPIAPGFFEGRYRGRLGFFRLDRQMNANNVIFFRSSLDAFHDTNPNGIVGGNTLPSVARVFRRRTYSEALGETSAITSNVVNSVRLQFQLASPITQFDPVVYGTQYQVPVSTGGAFTTGTSQSALLLNHQYQIADTLTTVKSRHTLNFGSSVIGSHSGDSKEFGGPIYLGQVIYNTCTQNLAVCESPAYLNNIANVKTYTQSYGKASYSVNDILWALFVQDDYKLRPNVTVNLGLRYERQTFTDFSRGFAPRVGLSWNPRADGATVLRAGFGIYYSSITDNSEANYALTGPTGVFNYTAAPGQIGFPSSVASAPLPAFPAGAQAPLRSLYIRPGDSANLNQFFPTSALSGYPDRLLNPYSQQWTAGIERKLAPGWVLRADYVGSHTLRINRPLDVDAPAPFIRTAPGQIRTPQAANCTRPYWILWYAQNRMACNPVTATNPQPPYAVIQSDVNDGYSYYHALQVNLNGRVGQTLGFMASYTWSHTIDSVDPDVPGQNPNDANYAGRIENGNAIFDQRHRAVLSGVYVMKWGIHIGGTVTLASGLPYNFTTGTTNSGDTGATTDRPVIDGVVVGRNAGRGSPVYELSPLMERPFRIGEHLRIEPRIEVFNLLNHPNFLGFSGIYGNGANPGAGFGQPLAGVTNQLPARSIQFAVKVTI